MARVSCARLPELAAISRLGFGYDQAYVTAAGETVPGPLSAPCAVADQTVNPTYTGDLAPAAIALAESGLEGVVHLVAAGCAGWDEFNAVATKS